MKRRFSIMRSRTSSRRSSVMTDGLPLCSSSCTRYRLLQIVCTSMHHMLAHGVRRIDLVQLTMNFGRRYARCIQKLYHRTHFIVGGSWNKSLHLQPLQRCYCETREDTLVHTSCDVITLSCAGSRFTQ